MVKLRTLGKRTSELIRHQQCRYYSAPTDGSIPANKVKYVPTEGTYPKGFVVGSAHAGVKASNTKFNDLALIASERLCAAAGLFTVNAFKAAPVQVSQSVLARTHGSRGVRGVVINSGCANAVTGLGGKEDAITMASAADRSFAIQDESEPRPLIPVDTTEFGKNGDLLKDNRMLVMSTGVIGQSWLGAAKAICTTDTFPKLISRQFKLPSDSDTTYSIAGMTKGAGMIHPNMATLLSVICTDVKIQPHAMPALLKKATNSSFNCISIDGDTSTNDTVNFFANGAAAPKNATALDSKNGDRTDYDAFAKVLEDFMQDLAKLIVRDGEGATKFVTVEVKGAYDNRDAKAIANSIVRSPLVKTALYGKDANWGRILCAVGYSSARSHIVPSRTSVSFIPADGSEELKLLVKGEPETVDEVRAKAILEMEDLTIRVRLDDGDGEVAKTPSQNDDGNIVMWTCDFSHEYVTINGDYRT